MICLPCLFVKSNAQDFIECEIKGRDHVIIIQTLGVLCSEQINLLKLYRHAGETLPLKSISAEWFPKPGLRRLHVFWHPGSHLFCISPQAAICTTRHLFQSSQGITQTWKSIQIIKEGILRTRSPPVSRVRYLNSFEDLILLLCRLYKEAMCKTKQTSCIRKWTIVDMLERLFVFFFSKKPEILSSTERSTLQIGVQQAES